MIGQTVSHYKIIAKLGEGGMGVVYKAQDLKLDRFVALKFLPQALVANKPEKMRFVHEAKAASALDHPNICTIHEINETDDGQMFIAMAYYEGETLQKRVTKDEERGEKGDGRKAKSEERDAPFAPHYSPVGITSGLPVVDAIEIATQIAQGLAKAHAHGIVHRDLKPANVMVTKDGMVKILDFGLALLSDQPRLTKTGSTVGTMAYMSPEQARGEQVDHRTDIWALGVVLYEMLTGQLPFKGEYEHAILFAILKKDPQSITDFRSDVPMELEQVVEKALAKNPGKRYQQMNEMLLDLKSASRSLESKTAKPIKRRLPKRKRKFLYGGMAAVFISLIAVGLYFFPAQKNPIDSIAVLPLANLSGDPNQEFFADGMTEALIADLAQIEALKVISRTSVMRYKGTKKPLPEIAKELKVQAVVEGSALRSGERVRIIAQLIEAATDRHLWGKSYERDLGDVLALQSEVARAVAQEIKIKLTLQEQAQLTRARRIDPEAHVAYLKGRYYWNKYAGEGFQQAIEYFQQAIDKDPSHALAYTGLADAYIQFALGSYRPAQEVMPKAKAAVTRALQIDDRLAEAHLSWGTYKMFHEWNWPEAKREFQRALELNPNSADARHFYGHYLQVVGRVEEAIVETTHAWELDPFSLAINNELGWAFYLARRYDEAIVQYKKTLEIDPNFVFTVWSLAMAYAEMGRPEEAIAELKKFEAAGKGWPTFFAEFGYSYAISGKKTKALEVLQQLQARARREYIDPALIVNIYTALGEKDQAFTWLEKAYDERSCAWMPWLKVEPKFDRLRSDPRFTALLQKMELEK